MNIRALCALATISLAACGSPPEREFPPAPARAEGTPFTVRDSVISAFYEATGVASPMAQSTVATKLMGTVTEVLVREGDRVAAGQPLVRVDSRDLDARQVQAAAGIASAEAARANAAAQARRVRSLYADSAAPRATLDATEAALSQAEAALRSAHAAATEVESAREYAVVRAPFAGVVTHRFVDPGAFATPGAPLVTVQDASRLRLAVTAAPASARGLTRGAALDGTVDGRAVRATIEGSVPASAGGVYTVNAIVGNADGALQSGTPATLLIPAGTRRALLVPAGAIVRQGDLTGVRVRTTNGDELRWVKLGGARAGAFVEVTSGVRPMEQVIVATAARGAAK
jgi:RND family efflux transporter MFP subunit